MFLVDTGSSDTIIPMELYRKIPECKRPKLIQLEHKVYKADGTPLVTYGKIKTVVQVGKSKVKLDIIVAEIKGDGILGMDFLLSVPSTLDLNNFELKCEEQIIECTEKEDSKCARVFVNSDVIIPAEHEVIVPCRLKKMDKSLKNGYIEGANRSLILDKGLLVARTLVNLEDNVLPVRVWNPHSEDIFLKENTTAGLMKPVTTERREPGFTRSCTTEEDRTVPSHLIDLLERSCVHLDEEQKIEVQKLLTEFPLMIWF